MLLKPALENGRLRDNSWGNGCSLGGKICWIADLDGNEN